MSISPRRIGKYELQEQLGQGGMAEVWKAYDVQLHRHVAIKLLHANLQEDPNFIARFEREAQLIASLHHPNIVQVHDFQVASSEAEGTTAYMVMDYIEGRTLAHYIDSTSRQGNIPYPEQIVQLFTSIALAVDYAHSKSMIHRDLKPANILLDKRNTTNNPIGEPILTDFGLAKLLNTSAGTLTSTQPGTPLYISPEQVSGYAGNERSDIYSLGIILYEMVTGTVPFQGDDPTAVMTQHLRATPPSPRQLNPNIPPALEVVIQRCLSKDPAARFPTASSLAAAIAEALNVAVPERLGKPAYPVDVVDMPTYFTPSNLLPHMTPTSPSLPVVKTSTASTAALPYPQATVSANSRQNTPLMPLGSGSGTPTPTYASPHGTPLTPSPSESTPAGVLSPTPPVAPPAQPLSAPAAPVFGPRPPRRRRGLILAILALILLIIGVSLATFFLFLLPANRPPVVTSPIVGHAFYVSSGQLNDGAQGIADELQVDLQHVSPPPSGKSYYLWLLADKDTTSVPDLLVPSLIHPPILVTNNLPVQNSSVHYTYTGDAQHNNLLSETSRLLITLEEAGRTPVSPSADSTTWKYYAQLPQAYIPKDSSGLHLRGLDHIRHLYYNENHLKVLALYGGLDIWVFRNTEKILEWSTAARDDFDGTTNNYGLMHDLFISILDYLDGVSNVHVDVPPGTPVRANANYAKVALLTVDPTKQGVAQYLDTNPPGDLDHLTLHLSELVKAPDASPQLRQVGQQVLVAIANAEGWLKQVRVDAKQLFDMTPDQLAQPAAQNLLEDLVAQATYAYIGQLDTATNKIKPGITQAHYDVQKLATFDIMTQMPKNL